MEIKNYNNDIPDDYYEVMSILQDRNGTLITLDGINNEVKEFEIWEDDLFFDDYVGIYHSYKPIGVAFVTRDK